MGPGPSPPITRMTRLQIAAEGLTLRAYRASDLDALEALVTDPFAMAQVGGALRRDEVAGLLERYRTPDGGLLAALAVEDEAGTYVGSGLLVWNEEAGAPELGYLIAPAHRRRGIATRVARALASHALGELGAKRVVARVDSEHTASTRVLERAGLSRAGRDAKGKLLYARSA